MSKAVATREIRVTEPIWPVLAGLRFFFAMWVLSDHTWNFGPPERAMPVLSGSGLMPVVCFLAISGFSIHHSIVTRRSGYLIRRFWRIVPTNLASVGIALAAYLIIGSPLLDGRGNPWSMPTLSAWLVYMIPASSIFPLFIPVLFPTWSLSIEIAYYAMAPLLLKAGRVVIPAAIIISACGFAIWNYLPSAMAPRYVAEATYGIGIVVFAWAWLAGWLAYKNRGSTGLFIGFVIIGSICTIMQPYGFQLNDWKADVATYVTWIGTIAILMFRPNFEINAAVARALDYLGDLSFPLYLVHYPVLFALTNSVWKAHPDWNYGFVQVIAALGAGVAVLHLVERPLRGVRTSLMRPPAIESLPQATGTRWAA